MKRQLFVPEQSVVRSCREMEVMPFRVACGEFIGSSDVAKEELEQAGFALVPEGFPYQPGMFAVHARGTSMQPRVNDKDWCIFFRDIGGTRQNRIVLVEEIDPTGLERYTLKKYRSDVEHLPDGTWTHRAITLWPLNGSQHLAIPLDGNGDYHIRGWFVGCVRHIQRVEKYQYESFSQEI